MTGAHQTPPPWHWEQVPCIFHHCSRLYVGARMPLSSVSWPVTSGKQRHGDSPSVMACPFVFCELKTKRYRTLRKGPGRVRKSLKEQCFVKSESVNRSVGPHSMYVGHPPNQGPLGQGKFAPSFQQLECFFLRHWWSPELDGRWAHRPHEVSHENVFIASLFSTHL